MQTAIGVILGALATVLASRYYYLRSIKKSLGVYRLLDSLVFAGIEPGVREQLHFRFREKEVTELQQVVLLIANDGERAISNVLEAPTITVPEGVELLDASIQHRDPESLQVRISTSTSAQTTQVAFEFPLLNRGEFFVVKLLLSGHLSQLATRVSILADDLPRSLPILDLPPTALEDRGAKMEWPVVLVGVACLLVPAWIGYPLYLLRSFRPELFPYPWSSFVVSITSLVIVLPSILLLLVFTILGGLLLLAATFGGQFPPPKARFPLPKELRNAVLPWSPHAIVETPRINEGAAPTLASGKGSKDPSGNS